MFGTEGEEMVSHLLTVPAALETRQASVDHLGKPDVASGIATVFAAGPVDGDYAGVSWSKPTATPD